MHGMKTIAVTALLAFGLAGSVAFAQGNGNGNGKGQGGDGGNGNGHGASSMAPGHMKGDGGSARDFAPGQRSAGDSAREFAPGQRMNALRSDDGATASVRRGDNYGTLISLLRSGRGDLSGVAPDVDVTVIDVDSVIPNGNRRALDNALDAREAEIDALRETLDELDAAGMAGIDLRDVVAAETAADGSLIVYVDE